MRVLLPIGLALALLAPGSAHHCTTYTTSDAEVTAAGFYVENDLCNGPECIGWVSFHQESNGIPGLQRGDEVVDDTCHGMIEPDTYLL